MTKEMENCRECVSEKEDRIEQKMEEKRAKSKSWFGLIEKVKKGPVSDIICLIPKIRYFHLFGDIFEVVPIHHLKKFQQEDYLILFKMVLKYYGDLDFCVYLAKAIKAQNVEMVKFLGTEIHRKHEFSANVSLPKYIKEEAERSYNKEILKYLNFLTEDNENCSGYLKNSVCEN